MYSQRSHFISDFLDFYIGHLDLTGSTNAQSGVPLTSLLQNITASVEKINRRTDTQVETEEPEKSQKYLICQLVLKKKRNTYQLLTEYLIKDTIVDLEDNSLRKHKHLTDKVSQDPKSKTRQRIVLHSFRQRLVQPFFLLFVVLDPQQKQHDSGCQADSISDKKRRRCIDLCLHAHYLLASTN